MTVMMTPGVGDQLRAWRARRRMSQLDLALDAGVSQRHLSFIESGRAAPSREMVLTLAERLELPLRERNRLLLGAGFAPVYPERSLDDEALAAAREAVRRVLEGHEPYPALAVDRGWRLVMANRMIRILTVGAAAALLEPPVNVLRLSLHPEGLAPRIVNLGEWRAHALARLQSQIEASADEELEALYRELAGYPAPEAPRCDMSGDGFGSNAFVTPIRLRTERCELSMFSTTTVFGTPVDVTLSELAIEAFYPADRETAAHLNALAQGASAIEQ